MELQGPAGLIWFCFKFAGIWGKKEVRNIGKKWGSVETYIAEGQGKKQLLSAESCKISVPTEPGLWLLMAN